MTVSTPLGCEPARRRGQRLADRGKAGDRRPPCPWLRQARRARPVPSLRASVP